MAHSGLTYIFTAVATYLINFIVLLFAGGKKTAAVVEGDHESSLVGGC